MEITFQDVRYQFHHSDLFWHFDLCLKGPKLIGVMGFSKTLFLELLGGLHLPNRGVIQIDGIVLSESSQREFRRMCSFLRQDVQSQFLYSTLEKEVLSLSHFLGKSEPYLKRKITQALQIVGLEDSYRNRDFHEVSRGEAKLLQLAFVLIQNSKIVLLDEPFMELDYMNRKRVLRCIRMLKEKYHKMVIIASNDSDLQYTLTEEVIVLYDGGVGYQGNTERFFQTKNIEKKYGISVPSLVKFTTLAKKKKIKLSYHKDIRDLIKDVYKHV